MACIETMTQQTAPDGIILFAHGSRDPLWRWPIEAVASRIRDTSCVAHTSCAYLELCEPGLEDACKTMLEALQTTRDSALSARSSPGQVIQKRFTIRIVPMFLGMGKHAREDLPRLVADLRRAHPNVSFEIMTTVGENERVTALLAQIASASYPQ
jgi:sirohydrochlorin cobaltochelatase